MVLSALPGETCQVMVMAVLNHLPETFSRMSKAYENANKRNGMCKTFSCVGTLYIQWTVAVAAGVNRTSLGWPIFAGETRVSIRVYTCEFSLSCCEFTEARVGLSTYFVACVARTQAVTLLSC
jgi:hypothetical protein